MSIWDQPVTPGTTLTREIDKSGRAVAMVKANLTGETTHGPLLNTAGRGVVNGRPYGEQLQTEYAELNEIYRYRPAIAARLRAATNAALGR